MKAAALTLLKFVSDDNTSTWDMKDRVFAPENFERLDHEVPTFGFFPGPNGPGDVTYTQCDDDAGVFTFDSSATKNDPAPVVKGVTVKFHLAGIVSDEIEVHNLHVHVLWNGSPLYDEDNKQDNKYDSQYAYDLKWDVPKFAPDGNFDITLTGTGKSADCPTPSADCKVLCVGAKFKWGSQTA